MPDTLIGRKEEQAILHEAFNSDRAEMVAVFGRRRVGKTFLIKETYQDHIAFGLPQNSRHKDKDKKKPYF